MFKPCPLMTWVLILLISAVSAGLLFRCANVKEEPAVEEMRQEQMFPHPDNWAEHEQHGTYVINKGTLACSAYCHGDSLEGSLGPVCNSCHPDYPHAPPEVWASLPGHGFYAMSKGLATCETACHGSDLLGGYDPNGKKTCVKCHLSYPNLHKNKDWIVKAHGEHVRESGFENCLDMCHHKDVPQGYKPELCEDCHADYPHLGDWTEGHGVPAAEDIVKCKLCHGNIKQSDCRHCHHKDNANWIKSGHIASAKISTQACIPCHGAGLKGGETGVSCFDCHRYFPHEAGWALPENHGSAANSDIAGCKLCHKDLIAGKCKECHHANKANWRGAEHGKIAFLDKNGCKVCHGGDLKGGESLKSCSECHDTFAPHPSDWALASAHGAEAVQNVNKCKKCHGEITGIACKSCHHDNDPDWITLNHKSSAKKDKDGCKVCHGENFSGGDSGISCYDCHSQYPHKPGWSAKALHGAEAISDANKCKLCHISVASEDCKSCHHANNANWLSVGHKAQARVDITSCKVCHGADLAGGESGVSCASCHADYPHPVNWAIKSQHGTKAIANIASCNKCHTSPVSADCKSCHHMNDTNWLSIDHKASAKISLAGCQICHGANFTGGVSGISCFTCHANYPHPVNWAIKSQHGTKAIANIASCNKCHTNPVSADCKSCHHLNDTNWLSIDHKASAKVSLTGCKICHGADLKGGLSAKNCYDCHDPGNVYPHPANIASSSIHPNLYEAHPTYCRTACHGTNLLGGISGKRCNRCHGLP